ncbi:MAG: hypothetical protein AAGE84_24245 [Cyanobacteria bacterium P01_G01_bin.39]
MMTNALFYSPGSNNHIATQRSRAIADFKTNIEIIFEDRINLDLVCPRNTAMWLRLNAEIFAWYEVLLFEGLIRVTSSQKEKIEQFRLLKRHPGIQYLHWLSQIQFDPN